MPSAPLDASSFLAWSAAREGLWELVDGVPVERPRSRRQCEAVAASNMLTLLHRAARAKGTRVLSRMPVRVDDRNVLVPDLVVVDAPRDPEATVVEAPRVVVDVRNFHPQDVRYRPRPLNWTEVPSVQAVVEIDPDFLFVSGSNKVASGGWNLFGRDRADEEFEVDFLEASFRVGEIYDTLSPGRLPEVELDVPIGRWPRSPDRSR